METNDSRLRAQGPRRYLTNDAGAVIGFGDDCLQVKSIPAALAKETIRRRHYSGTVVQNSYVHLGVYHQGDFAGALQFGYALNPNSGAKLVPGTPNRGYLELNRMWVADSVPRNGETMALAFAIRAIRRLHPGVRWIQTYADERCGKWGAVYQAASFLYVGFHWTDFWYIDGVAYHDMLMTCHKMGGGRGAFLRANVHRAEKRRFRQFRYFFPLHPAARRRLTRPVLPYPKPGFDGRE